MQPSYIKAKNMPENNSIFGTVLLKIPKNRNINPKNRKENVKLFT